MTLLVAQLGFSPRTSAPARSSTSTRGASQSFGLLTIWVTERIFVVRDRFQVFLGCPHSNSSSYPVKGEDQQWTLAVPTRVLELFRLSCAPATPKVHFARVFLLPSCFPLSFEGSSPALLVTREVLRNRLVGVLLRQSYSAPFTVLARPSEGFEEW